MKKIAVILSGCGNKDGTEITEAVSLIISLSQLKAKLVFFAPNSSFFPVNFIDNSQLKTERNMMIESARMTRGQIEDLKNLNADDFDGLAIPGGKGAAVHLSNWANLGAGGEVNSDLKKIILSFYQQKKPIAAICIAPVIIAKILGEQKILLTIGDDIEMIAEIKKTGAQHEICPANNFISDRDHKIITTPAYMYDDAKPHQVFEGIAKLSKELMEMA